jgi:hypothetical protein
MPLRQHRGQTSVEISATVNLSDDEGNETEADVEVTVKAHVSPPTKPTIRMDPDDCDPGDSGDFDIISVTRDDTGEDITDKVDCEQFWDKAIEDAEGQDEAAYEDAMEARAETQRERDYFGDDNDREDY